MKGAGRKEDSAAAADEERSHQTPTSPFVFEMQRIPNADPPFGVVNSIRNPALKELAQGDFEILGPFSHISRGLFRLLFTASFYSSFYSLSTSLTQSY